MLFILDRKNEVVGSLNSNGDLSRIATYFDDEYVQDLGTGAETFKFSTLADNEQSEYLVVGNSIAFKHDGDFKLFTIIQIEETHEDTFIKTVYCEMAGIELINEIIRPMKVLNSSLRKFLTSILEGTEWQLGILDTRFTDVYDFEITDYKSAYELIQEYAVGTFGAEISYRVEIAHGQIVGKYIDCYYERGKSDGFRFAYGSNLTSVTKTVDMSNIATALIGVGKSNITFKEVETSDKPLNQDFIENKDAFKRWNVNGSHIFGTHKADTDSPQELLRLTRIALEERSNPQIKYEMKVELLGKEVKIGDTVYVIDHEFNPPLHLSARVNQLTTSKTNPYNDEVVLANFKEVVSNISDEMRQIASQLEGYVDGQFPIGGDKIENGAISGDKLANGQIIQGTHLFANSITADKIKAGEIQAQHIETGTITADHLSTGELITDSAQIGSAVIDSVHIKEGIIDSIHINDGSITSAKIGDAQIGTAQIKDAEITVAKIQDAFIDNLVATQGKFESAHIGILTSENIDANTIRAEHISANVIDAINMNVEGKITADKIDVSSLTVENIDAGKITTGTLDADRITSSVITAINASIENATINSAKIGNLSADKITSGTISADRISASVIDAINMTVTGKISAEHIDVDSIKVNNIDAGKITTGTLDADRITGSVVQAINMSAGKIDAKNINVEGLKVGQANIVNGSIVSAHIGTGQISNAHIDKAFVADSYIKNLNASVITTGTLDASKVNVTNLRADNIVAGSITVEGNNLLKNTRFLKGFDNWTVEQSLYSIDDTLLCEGEKSVKFNKVGGDTSAKYLYQGRYNIKAVEGQQFVGTMYYHVASENVALNNKSPYLGIWYYSDTAVLGNTRVPVTLVADTWVRVQVNGIAPSGCTSVALVCAFDGVSGNFNVAKPMLSKGTISSIWKPHTDEMISDGAIDNDKIANESITADKLVIDTLWADEGFISNFQSANIDAGQITTGKISGEYIDITGLVSFDDLNPEISQHFLPTRDENGNITKTWINGATVATGTVTADKINTRGFTAKDELGNITFNIDESTGEVNVKGNISSINYKEGKEGYQLQPNGQAEFNDAVVRGSVILPKSGMTNEGMDNLIPYTDFSINVTSKYKVRGSNTALSWSSNDGGYITCRNSTLDVADGGCGILTPNIIGGLKANQEYTLSFKARSSSNTGTLDYIYIMSNETGVSNQKIGSVNINAFDKWDNTQSITFTPKVDYPNASILIGFTDAVVTGNTNPKGFAIKEIRLVEGNTPSMWFVDSPVRFWAGASFENRDDAPFKVLQDGSVIATKGNFGGTITGKLNIGNIHIEDTNSTNGFIDIKTNDDRETKVHLEESNSYINSNLALGSDFVNFNVSNSKVDVKGKLNVSNTSNYSTTLGHGAYVLDSNDGTNQYIQRYSSGRYTFDSYGKQATDYIFVKESNKTPVKVEVWGEMYARDKITMNNNIAIVARQDAGNSGFDYVVK